MAVAFVVGWVVLAAILDLTVGLVVLAAAAGWLTGTAVALGAEPGTAYVTSLAILPASSLDLLARMTNAPFLEVVSASFVPAGPLELLALVIFGWLGAR
jgi:hypothetical protein